MFGLDVVAFVFGFFITAVAFYCYNYISGLKKSITKLEIDNTTLIKKITTLEWELKVFRGAQVNNKNKNK